MYVKDVPFGKDGFDEDTIPLEVTSTPLPTQEIHVQLQPAPVKVSPSKSQTLASIPVPVSIDSLNSLVQAAAIQIVHQPEGDDGRLHQYKMQVRFMLMLLDILVLFASQDDYLSKYLTTIILYVTIYF